MDKRIDEEMADIVANGERFASTAKDPRQWPTIARGGKLSPNPDGVAYPEGILDDGESIRSTFTQTETNRSQ
jgi:hypothetical protein